ncbi:MAG: hypothetical protein HYS60_01810 [Candidatus Wildermuthbacteria bacterium]|nr:hypothetical protein [Candidatus Wildermuthbacteria bacterium]
MGILLSFSHSPGFAGICGDFGLSPDQVAVLRAIMKAWDELQNAKETKENREKKGILIFNAKTQGYNNARRKEIGNALVEALALSARESSAAKLEVLWR